MESATAALPHFLDAVLLLKVQQSLSAFTLWCNNLYTEYKPCISNGKAECICNASPFKTCDDEILAASTQFLNNTEPSQDAWAKRHPAFLTFPSHTVFFLARTFDLQVWTKQQGMDEHADDFGADLVAAFAAHMAHLGNWCALTAVHALRHWLLHSTFDGTGT